MSSRGQFLAGFCPGRWQPARTQYEILLIALIYCYVSVGSDNSLRLFHKLNYVPFRRLTVVINIKRSIEILPVQLCAWKTKKLVKVDVIIYFVNNISRAVKMTLYEVKSGWQSSRTDPSGRRKPQLGRRAAGRRPRRKWRTWTIQEDPRPSDLWSPLNTMWEHLSAGGQ